MEMLNETYFNDQEAANYARYSVGTLRNMRSARRGPRFLKVGGGRAVRYRKSDLDAWLNAQPVLTRDSIE